MRDQIAGLGPRHAAADEQERPLGPRDQARGASDCLRVGRRRVSRPVPLGRDGVDPDDLVVQHVAGDVDEHRSLAARHGRPEGQAEGVGDPVGPGHLDRQLRHGAEQGDEVELLERVASGEPERGPAGDGDDGGVRHERAGDARHEVRRARPAGHQAHRRRAGDPREPVGHEGAPLLVADVDVLDAPVVVEDVEHVQEGRADDPEHVPHAFGLQELHHGVSGAHLGHGAPSPPRAGAKPSPSGQRSLGSYPSSVRAGSRS
jgi:hypothetical protein